MIFNTPIFYYFFLIFLFVYGIVLGGDRKVHRPKVLWIIISSLVFYGAWNYRFIPLILFSAVVDYYIALALDRSSEPKKRKWLVTTSIVVNLGLLGIFKYADFALLSVQDFLSAVGVELATPTLEWVLPVGISFYTFQSLSYTIDVYRGDMKAKKGLAEFTAALTFFPQLVAGPILRARQILPQMHSLPVPTWENVKYGALLITAGVFKKTIADLLAIPAARAFDGDLAVNAFETWTGVLAFAGQIYGDFAGYTDMAIGIALVLGFRIPLNFNLPYFAVSPVDFWRRWHISLSTWLRDYLYISLGGNRRGGRWRNVMITMLLGGLWHGAAWTFVLWGAFHGVAIVLTHAFAKVKAFASFHQHPGKFASIFKWALTFYVVLIGWVFFRAQSIGDAWDVLAIMHGASAEMSAPLNAATFVMIATIVAVIVMHLFDLFVLKAGHRFIKYGWLLWPVLIILHALLLMIGEPSDEFIYFQF